LLFLYLIIYLTLAFYNLVQSYKIAPPLQRTQIKYVFLGAIIAVVLGATTNLVLIQFGISQLSVLGPFSILVFTGFVSFAITKHELMNIQVVITRAVAYGISALLLVVSFIVLNAFKMPLPILMFSNAILALFWAYAAHRLREFVQTPLEEKWITGWYDSDRLINTIARRLVPVMERQEAFKITADELKGAIKIKKVDILTGRECPDIKEVRRVGKGVEIPLISSEGLEGVLRLGEKVSEDPYDDKDLQLFGTLQVQILSILDRIRPYEKIKKEFEANQKKLYDTERLLARSEKIASMASLIQEYNHQVKTPLGIIRGRIEILFDKTRDEEYLKKVQELILEQIDRASYIVDSTLRLSRPRERQEVLLNLNNVVDEALKLFPPSGVTLIKELKARLTVKGDVEDLETVFINLIKNAVEAMPNGGELKVVTYDIVEDGEAMVCAEVSDAGIGIPQANREKIFEPFFSTSVTKGKGLGLSIVFKMIREHLGKIDVKSQPGSGSLFTIKIPAVS